MVAGVQGWSWERARALWMKQEICDGSGVIRIQVLVYIYRREQEEGERKGANFVVHSPPMNGGVGKCGQNAGREIFKKPTRTINR